MKKLAFTRRTRERHWVGDGFPVRTIFSYDRLAEELSPFLLLDYAGPANFPPTEAKHGVGEHPHRGFETVTIVYDGEVEHRDSSGGGGRIGPGDVQWMTAGSGVVHEEFHGRDYARRGGPFEMVQLWVNLPRKDKLAKPRYQSITTGQIPRVLLPDGAGSVRVIAGKHGDAEGPALTFSPINVWDVRAAAGKSVRLELRDGDTAALFVLKGRLRLPKTSGTQDVGEAELAVLETAGADVSFEALEDTTLLVLSGTPHREPVVGYGPFVMSTEDEIRQAFLDYESGRMGHLPS